VVERHWERDFARQKALSPDIEALLGELPKVLVRDETQVPKGLGDEFASCGRPILGVKAIDTAASFIFFICAFGNVGL
jgi:hypothetical protein